MIKNYQMFKDTTNNVIQNSGLDIGAVYFILKDIVSDIEKMYFAQINRELLEEQKQNIENNKEQETAYE